MMGLRKLKRGIESGKYNPDFDYILIDSPPLGQVIDAAIIANVCEGAVLILESGAVSYHAAQKVKNQLERTGCRILGVVLNKVDRSSKGAYGSKYGRYGKYGKYGRYGKYGKYGYGYGENKKTT